MTYRMKLFILVLTLVVISNGLCAIGNYRRADDLLRAEVHRKTRAIANSAAAMLDGDKIALLRARADEARPEYAELRAQLRKVRDANRRNDTWVTRIFTLMPAKENPDILEYGEDTEEHFELTHNVGDIYLRESKPFALGLGGIDRLADRLRNFQDGYRTAFAAIRDSKGRQVAELGVITEPTQFSTISALGPSLIVPFAVTLVLALISAWFLSRSATRPLYALRQAIDAIGRGDFSAKASTSAGGEFAEMAASINAMAAGLRERDTIKRAFSGYISRQVLDAIVANGDHLAALKGERRRVTVLFSDIRGFTELAEAMLPEAVVELLTEFFDRMVEVTIRNHGTIDKFLGDGMMVIFGAPLDDAYQEQHAVTAALEMQHELRELCAKWEKEGRPPVRMGIGINSGNAVVGNIGSLEHIEYTAVGDTVNLASRLESVTKELGVEIIVSEPTYDAVRPLFQFKSAGTVNIRGRHDAVHAYSVEGPADAKRANGPA